MNLQLLKLAEAVHDALCEYNWKHKPWHHNLCGACAVGAYFLNDIAERRGLPCTLHVRPGHAFCTSEGLIYDPTHIQFVYSGSLPDGYAKVGVYTKEDLLCRGMSRHYERSVSGGWKSCDTTDESIQEMNRWCIEQRPNTYDMLWEGETAILVRVQSSC